MFFFCKSKTAYEMRISDWSSDVCSSDLNLVRSILEAAPVPVAMVRSQDGLVVYESPASRKIFGRLLHSGEPSYISDLYVDPEDRRRYLALLREKGSVEGYEVQLRRYDGQPIWVAITAKIGRAHV